jgi:MFS family permease
MVPIHGAYLMDAIGVNSPEKIGFAMALNSVGVVVGTLTFGWIIAPRLNVPSQIALSVAISGIGFYWMGTATFYETLTLAVMVNGFGSGLLLPTMVTWNMRELPFTHRGLGTGAFTSSLMFGMFLNPIIIIYFSNTYGGRAVVIGALGVALGALALTAVFAGMRRSTDQAA